MKETVTAYLCLAAILTMILIPFVLAFEDGIRFGLLKRLLCKVGFHKMKTGKIRKYYCLRCKKGRKYPDLKSVGGGR